MSAELSLPIGYFVEDGRLLCKECTEDKFVRIARTEPVKVYEENIRPYSQDCHNCGKLLVNGIGGRDGAPLMLFYRAVKLPLSPYDPADFVTKK